MAAPPPLGVPAAGQAPAPQYPPQQYPPQPPQSQYPPQQPAQAWGAPPAQPPYDPNQGGVPPPPATNPPYTQPPAQAWPPASDANAPPPLGGAPPALGAPPPAQQPYPPQQPAQAWGAPAPPPSQPPYDPNNPYPAQQQTPYGGAPPPPASSPYSQPPPATPPPPYDPNNPYGGAPPAQPYGQQPPYDPNNPYGGAPPAQPYGQAPPPPNTGYQNPFAAGGAAQNPAPDANRYYDPNAAQPPPAAPAWPPPVDQYSQPQQPYGAPPPSEQYGQPPPSGQYGQPPPPTGQYGQPPPAGQYGQPPPSGQYGQPPAPGYDPNNPYAQQQQPPPGQYGAPVPVPAQPAWGAPPGGSGRKKALLIGINYTQNVQLRLKGCVRDVEVMAGFISQRYGFSLDPNWMRILVDDAYRGPGTVSGPPTKVNILNGFAWLLQGVQQGDNLFFQFSGHGSQLADQDNDEADGMDETIIPCDYRGNPDEQIRDDTLFDMLVAPMVHGSSMTAVMDCCHSGTGMDLPYIFTANDMNMGCIQNGVFDPTMLPSMLLNHKFGKNTKLIHGGLKILAKFAGKMAAGNAFGMPAGGAGGLGGGAPGAGAGGGGFQQDAGKHKHSMGHVVLISGCDDDQTSADLGTKGGACTNSLIEVLGSQPDITIIHMLEQMRVSLRNRGLKQIPQLSSTHQLKLDAKFVFA